MVPLFYEFGLKKLEQEQTTCTKFIWYKNVLLQYSRVHLEININKDSQSINWNINQILNANVTVPLCNEFGLKKLEKSKNCNTCKPLQFKHVRYM